MDPTVVLVLLFVAAVIVVPIYFYNRLVVLRNRCKESWANVDTELKRRYDLIPNLVSTVRAYASHEREVLDRVVQLRNQAMGQHGSPGDPASDERPLVAALKTLFAVAENYPALKASHNFLELQRELAVTEDRIQAARRFYNANVRDYRDTKRTFPGNAFADAFRFPEIEFFEIDPLEVRAPDVHLGVTG